MRKKLFGMILAATVLATTISGCSLQKDDTDYYSPEVLGFTIPGRISVEDFNWFFVPKNYDKSNDKQLSPYGVVGVWEYANDRKPDTKSGYQKDLYWMNIEVEGKNGKMIGGDVDPSVAAEVYGFKAYNESEEAQNAGLVGSDTAGKLIEALNNIDGSVPCHVTMIQVGVEDSSGNYTDVNNAKPIELEGKYYPDYLFLKVDDAKGNRLTINEFVDNGTEQHAFATYGNPKKDYFYYGTGALFRKNK